MVGDATYNEFIKAYDDVYAAYAEGSYSTEEALDAAILKYWAGVLEKADGSDAIENIEAETPAVHSTGIYAINGIRVEKPRQGLYIINGKTVWLSK